MKEQQSHSRLWAVLHLRCPRCLEGKVFSGSLRMNETCPACGYRFGREPGYFIGAMYISYTASVVFTWVVIAILWWQFFQTWPILLLVFLGTLLLVPFVPLIFRYSRVIWMHFDWVIDPGAPIKK